MKSIVFFNNKGGVGKTTLTCNVVSFLSMHHNKRVLLIDADPQCNATQSILSEEECEAIYLAGNQKKNLSGGTLFDYLAPIEAGEPSVRDQINPLLGSRNKYGVDLIPGHPRMSLIEDKLSGAWTELNAGTPSGYRITNWCSQVFRQLESRYDIVVFDVGPSLGALNRTVILGADYFVAPFGCDIFSLLGIQNIASWISNWKKQYDRSIVNMLDDRPDLASQYPIVTGTNDKFRFAGYSVQQYVTKTFKTGPRVVTAYDKIMKLIPTTVSDHLEALRPDRIAPADTELGHIPFLYSLIPLSQASRSPIHALAGNAKLIGTQARQVENYKALMESFCQKLLHNIELS